MFPIRHLYGRSSILNLNEMHSRITSAKTKRPNKPRHATASSRSVEMISRNYNPKPVRAFRRSY
jgi:hypothetical protein